MSRIEGSITIEYKIENLSILATPSSRKLSNVMSHLFLYSGELYLGLQAMDWID